MTKLEAVDEFRDQLEEAITSQGLSVVISTAAARQIEKMLPGGKDE